MFVYRPLSVADSSCPGHPAGLLSLQHLGRPTGDAGGLHPGGGGGGGAPGECCVEPRAQWRRQRHSRGHFVREEGAGVLAAGARISQRLVVLSALMFVGAPPSGLRSHSRVTC